MGILFYGVIFFLVAHFFSRFIKLATSRLLIRKGNELIDPTVVLFVTQLAQIAVYVGGLIIFFHIIPVLQKLGTALLTGVSVMSVVFGLAAQNTLSNLVAGCTLLLYRPFHIEDLIQVATPTGTESGIVERLTLGYTMLRTMDDRLVIIPNSLMASQVSLNLNRRSLHVMTIVSVGVDDVSHITEVRNALTGAAQTNQKIKKIIGHHVLMIEDGNAIVSLRAWCATDNDAKEVRTEIYQELAQIFEGKRYISLAQEALQIIPVGAKA